MNWKILVIFFVALGCSSKPPAPSSPTEDPVDQAVLADFERGSDLLGRERYSEANAIFERILREKPVTEFDLVVMYNSAAALEGMKDCTRAADRYRKVVLGAIKKSPRLQAQGLFRLSYMYECLGDDAKIISTLLDARKRRNFLPEEISLAEIPSRLAAAYARIGNVSLAERFLKEAEQGLTAVQAKHRDSVHSREMLARTLFFMGRIDVREPTLKDSGEFLKGVRLLQGYLIKSASLSSREWSPRATKQLLATYERMWDLVQKVPLRKGEDSSLARRQRMAEQVELAELAVTNLEELKALRFPDTNEPRILSNLFAELNEYEVRFRRFLASNAELTPLTPEAEKRQGLKREGRVISPAPSVLEESATKAGTPSKTKKPGQK